MIGKLPWEEEIKNIVDYYMLNSFINDLSGSASFKGKKSLLNLYIISWLDLSLNFV